MENIGLGFPTLFAAEDDIISIIIQAIAFIVIAIIVVYVVIVYFKNVELKKDSERNSTEITENFEKIEKIKKWFIKIGSIVFAIIILATIILSNFI